MSNFRRLLATAQAVGAGSGRRWARGADAGCLIDRSRQGLSADTVRGDGAPQLRFFSTLDAP
jgi:hypothetical protein